MKYTQTATELSFAQKTSLAFSFIAILGVAGLGLTIPFISLLASYYIVTSITSFKYVAKLPNGKKVATLIIGMLLVFILIVGGAYGTDVVKSGAGLYASLKGNMAPHMLSIKAMLPSGVANLIPSNEDYLNKWGESILQSQTGTVISAGATLMEGFMTAIIGIIIGLVLANTELPPTSKRTELSSEVFKRAHTFFGIFKQVVLAQFWIAIINTSLTAILLLIILPIFGKHVPYSAVLILFTFAVGLLPIVGSLACNIVITLAGLSQGLPVAVACLLWLMAVHKLEYVVNAKILGSKTSIATWELLTVLFVSHAILGVPGLVLGPLCYAYIKQELKGINLI